MAQFEYLLEWHPRGFLNKMVQDEDWNVSNVTHHICKDFNDVDEAFEQRQLAFFYAGLYPSDDVRRQEPLGVLP